MVDPSLDDSRITVFAPLMRYREIRSSNGMMNAIYGKASIPVTIDKMIANVMAKVLPTMNPRLFSRTLKSLENLFINLPIYTVSKYKLTGAFVTRLIISSWRIRVPTS